MKKSSLIMLFALACASQPMSAQGYVLTSVAEEGSTYLNAAPDLYFGMGGSERYVTIDTNTSFAATSDATWCKVDVEGNVLTVATESYDGAHERRATITLSGKDGLTSTVNVCQYGMEEEQYPTFAVISDIHFGNTKGEGPMVKVPRTLKALTSKAALDALIVVGDLTDGGQAGQYDQFVQVFTDESNFINPVDTMLFMVGNHDTYHGNIVNYPAKLRPFNKGNDYPYDQYLIIKGYPFITISQRNSGSNADGTDEKDGYTSYPKEVRDRLEAWLKQAAAECPGKPIFVFTHVPPTYTCYSSWPGEGYREGTMWAFPALNPILNKYPQAVVFGGHSHYPLSDPRSIHQGVDPNSSKNNYFTGIGTGSVTYSEIHAPSVDEGIHPSFYDHITEGLIVDVKSNGNVELLRYDTRLDEEIQPDNRWVLQAPHDGSMFAYADKRDLPDNTLGKTVRTGMPAPVFAEDATIELTSYGPMVDFTFTAATDNEAVFRYHVRIVDSEGNTVKSNWLFSGFYKNSETPATYNVNYNGLEIDAEYTIVVEAYDSYDNVSLPLTRTYTQGCDVVEIPECIAAWNFDTPDDKLVASVGDIEMEPGKVVGTSFGTQKLLSDIGMEYINGPTKDNGALFVPKGASFRMKNPKRLSSYTIMYDVRIPDYSSFRALLQTNRTHDDDADLFINKEGAVGVGAMGYGGRVKPNKWHRIIISTVNGCPSVYLDGSKVCQASVTDNRWVISANSIFLFADNDGETANLDVAEIALWDVALTEAEVACLGMVSVEDIPVEPVDIPTCDGQWLFNQADDFYANAVTDVKLIPYKMEGKNSAPKAYDPISAAPVTKTDKGVLLNKEAGFLLPLSESGTLRNYTLIFDMKTADVQNFSSLLQTNLNNSDDGDMFINKGMIGVTAGGLTYEGSVKANTWHRIALVVSNGIISTYINGQAISTSGNTADDRWCLNKQGVYLFIDNDGERTDVELSGIHFWKQSLTAPQLRYLGKVE